MHYAETWQTLEDMGTAQNRKIYGRHGVGENMFGVSIANLKKLKKQIKEDHELAVQLWASGNHDARYLATFIADPQQGDDPLLESWGSDLDNYVITDAFVGYVSQTPLAQEKAIEWAAAHDEYIARAGWHLLAGIAQNETDLPDEFFDPYLETIQNEIHQKPNRTREGMNNALIAFGIRNPVMMEKALAVAGHIGPVEVDHGPTSCKTNFAPAYIERTVERKKAKGQWA